MRLSVRWWSTNDLHPHLRVGIFDDLDSSVADAAVCLLLYRMVQRVLEGW